MDTEKYTLDRFADLSQLVCGRICVRLSTEDELSLANIISACNCAKLRTSDVCDNVFVFMLKGDDSFNINEYDEDKDGNEIVKPHCISIEDSLWKVILGEYTYRNRTSRYMHIFNASNLDDIADINVQFVSVNEDTPVYNDHMTYIDADCAGLLSQIYDKVNKIICTSDSIRAYNESLDSIVPAYRKTYYVKRSEVDYLKVLSDLEDKKRQEIIDILKRHKKPEQVYSQSSHDLKITPIEYIRAWSAANASSYQNVNQSVNDNMTDDEAISYFKLRNSKGSELVGMISDDENKRNDPNILHEWYESNSCYHCMNVIYARTTLHVYGDKFVYSNSTSYYTDEFLLSLPVLEKVCGDNFYIDCSDTLIKMLNGEDYIRFTHSYADKYLRDYSEDFPCYQENIYNTEDVAKLEKISFKTVNDYIQPIESDREAVYARIMNSK